MNYFYYVIDRNINGGHYAFALRLPENYNLVDVLRRYDPFVVHTCKTWTQADEIAEAWNETFRANGTYAKN